MDDWTAEDWLLLQTCSVDGAINTGELHRMSEMLTSHRGQYPVGMSRDQMNAYCEALVNERLRQTAAKMATDVNVIE